MYNPLLVDGFLLNDLVFNVMFTNLILNLLSMDNWSSLLNWMRMDYWLLNILHWLLNILHWLLNMLHWLRMVVYRLSLMIHRMRLVSYWMVVV